MKRILAAIALTLALSYPSQDARAMVVAGSEPANLFVAGKPVEFMVSEAQGDVKYELLNYYGRTIAAGTAAVSNGSAKISVAALKPCWYELKCSDGKDSVTAYLGAVMDRGNAPLSCKGRVGVDSASAWLVKKPEQRAPLARMLRIAGIPWVRERTSWATLNADVPGVERNLGEYNFEKYQEVADTLHAEGVGICTVWQHVPGFAKPDFDKSLYRVGDYRIMYRLGKTLASHFAEQITAWEPWNESDMGYPYLSDTFAPIQKSFYLGLKAGNPKCQVMYTSVSQVTPEAFAYGGKAWFQEGNYACGVGDYFDLFNYHSYRTPWIYPSQLDLMRRQMRLYGIEDKPAWVTEAGMQLWASDGPDKKFLSRDNEQRTARFAAVGPTMSLVAGTDKFFYFVLPDYSENGLQFGLLHPDLTPNPAFLSLSACANIIGESEYIGEYNPNGRQTVCHTFSTPKGNVMVVWGEKETEVAVPTERTSVQAADLFGNTTTVLARDGLVRVKAKMEATYLLDIGDRVKPQLIPSKRYCRQFWQPDDRRRPKPSSIVLASFCTLPIEKGCDSYKLGASGVPVAGEPFEYTVEVYQFDEKKGASGTVELTGPEGWIIEEPKRPVKLGPMDRVIMTFKVTPVPSSMASEQIVVRGKFGRENVAPSCSSFRYFPNEHGL